MASEQSCVRYRRRGSIGTLTLRGVVDIFEAIALHGSARRILQDSRAASVRLDCSQVERLDLSAIQILLALRRDLTASGRDWKAEDLPSSLHGALEKTGCPL
jgi:anti-anti-sigma regulatory factor